MGLQLEIPTIGGVIEEREMQRETLPTTRSSAHGTGWRDSLSRTKAS